MAERNDDPSGLGINGVIPGNGMCVAEGCGRTIPEGRLMCRGHWQAVPNGVAAALNDAMWRWRQGSGTLADLRDAQWACVEAIG